MDLNQKLSEHFSLWECIRSETASRLGINNNPPEDYIPKLEFICKNILEPIRQFYNTPFRPNSVYRCKKLNQAVNGSSISQHMIAEATDFEVPGISNFDLAIWCNNHLEFDQLILECYEMGQINSGWVHASIKIYPVLNRKQVLTFTGNQYIAGLVK
jgi:zinc D-Ala-D-Ala carboxypeptidase